MTYMPRPWGRCDGPATSLAEIMPQTSDRLAAVALDGQALPFSHGVLIHAMHGWHLALYQVPAYACPAVSRMARWSSSPRPGSAWQAVP